MGKTNGVVGVVSSAAQTFFACSFRELELQLVDLLIERSGVVHVDQIFGAVSGFTLKGGELHQCSRELRLRRDPSSDEVLLALTCQPLGTIGRMRGATAAAAM